MFLQCLSSELFTHARLPHVSYCRVVLDLLVLGDSLFGDGMDNTIGELFYIVVVVVCEASWACYDEFVRRPNGLIVSVVDIFYY